MAKKNSKSEACWEKDIASNIKIKCKHKNTKQKEMANTILKNRITFVQGSAGTGKTLMALRTGIKVLREFDEYKIGKIVITTSTVEVDSQSIGYLPGDANMKTNVYFSHFYDNLNKIVGEDGVKALKGGGLISEKILNFIRGETFGDLDDKGDPIGHYCILDESQNITVNQMRSFISRLGENSKLIILGDTQQVDIKLKRGEKTGLSDAIERFKDMDGIGIVEFTEDDIVRDPFLIEIMKRYSNDGE